MTVRLNPYINFRNSAREALEFYHSVFGGDLRVMTFGENGMPFESGEADKVMHGQLEFDGMTLMASDVPNSMPLADASHISISLSGEDDARLRRYWDGLAAGGEIAQPLVQAPWGDTFGMLADKFGVSWMVNITAPRG